MKKLLLIVLCTILFLSCSNPQEKLFSRVDKLIKKELIPTLKDPKSFEKSKITIEDTVYEKQGLESDTAIYNKIINGSIDLIIKNTEQIEELKIYKSEKALELIKRVENNSSDCRTMLNSTKKSLNSALISLKKVDPKKIRVINISYQYRAKNGYGALDIDNALLKYIPNKDTLFIYKTTSKE